MTNTILLKRSSVSNKIPTVSQLSVGEIAINTHDGTLFTNYMPDNTTPTILQIGGIQNYIGDITGVGSGNITLTLPNVNSNIGTFQGLTINAKGQIISATNMNYAPLVSPALTGTPTTPTASPGTSNTQIASTAFVTTSVANAVTSHYNSTGVMTGVKSYNGIATTNSSGVFTLSYSSAGFTNVPALAVTPIGSGSTASSTLIATITSISSSTLTGIVCQPNVIVIGGYAVQLVGAGINVRILLYGN